LPAVANGLAGEIDVICGLTNGEIVAAKEHEFLEGNAPRAIRPNMRITACLMIVLLSVFPLTFFITCSFVEADAAISAGPARRIKGSLR